MSGFGGQLTSPRGRVDSGVALNASGQATITHNLSTTPATVWAKVVGTATYTAYATNYTSSTFVVTVANTASGAVLASTSVGIEWVAFFF